MPTSVRSFTYSVARITGDAAGTIAPFAQNLDLILTNLLKKYDVQSNFNPSGSYLLYGFLGFLTFCMCWFLPDTRKDKATIDTICELELAEKKRKKSKTKQEKNCNSRDDLFSVETTTERTDFDKGNYRVKVYSTKSTCSSVHLSTGNMTRNASKESVFLSDKL